MCETNALQVKSYNIDTQVFAVRYKVDTKNGYQLEKLKTKCSIRDIECSDYAHEIIINHIEYLKTLSGLSANWFICGGPKPVALETLRRIKDRHYQ